MLQSSTRFRALRNCFEITNIVKQQQSMKCRHEAVVNDAIIEHQALTNLKVHANDI